MEKVIYSLPIRQKTFMDRESDRLGISAAELVRRIIDQYADRPRIPPREEVDGRG